MACFCREKGQECIKWFQSQRVNSQSELFEYKEPENEEDHKKTEQNRFLLIIKLNEVCKSYRLGVSLNTRKYLWTPDPSNPINFWHYEPKQEKIKHRLANL